MLLQGFTLTVVGMTIVFIFLTIMVIVMKIVSTFTFIPKSSQDLPTDKKIMINKQIKKDSIENQRESMAIGTNTVSIGKEEIAAAIAAVKVYSQN